MSAAQELFELLKDARPKDGRKLDAAGNVPRKPGVFVTTAALKAIRFSVQLPELGGAVELSPHRGFSPIHCKHCGIERKSVQQSCVYEKTNKLVRWWAPVPCNCGGLRCE